jgi:hypothetical protein
MSISTFKNILVDRWEGGRTGDRLGFSVSISDDGNTALVGANDREHNTGAAYIFTKSDNSWSQTAVLTASDGSDADKFGRSVILSGDGSTALVGAYNKNNRSGAAYIFTKSANSGWVDATETAVLTASDGSDGDSFGLSIALNGTGDVALIGAYNKTINGIVAMGAAYIFTKSGSTWITTAAPTATLTASDGTKYDNFGYSVALSSTGDIALIGAVLKDTAVYESGAAYIFTKPTTGDWVDTIETSILTATDAAEYDSLGYSVALSSTGHTALIGTYGEDNQTGAAYIFTKSNDGWSTGVKLNASKLNACDYFNGRVALSGDGNTALLEAFYQHNQTSAVYIFTKPADKWFAATGEAITVANYGTAVDSYNLSTAINHDGSTVLVGVPNSSYKSTDSGSVYVFN